MPTGDYSMLSNEQLARILERIGAGEGVGSGGNEHRGVLLLEAARRLRGCRSDDDRPSGDNERVHGLTMIVLKGWWEQFGWPSTPENYDVARRAVLALDGET